MTVSITKHQNSLFVILVLIVVMGLPSAAQACSCAWQGPFLAVSQQAPLVVRGKIIRHNHDKTPSMDLLVLEVLKGAMLDSGLRIQTGDGMHCRPVADNFPVGSEWILALNGPGSKPGNSIAISHCGDYWLKVENGQVSGNIDGDQGQTRQMPLDRFKNRFLYPRFSESFRGELAAGQRFRRAFAGRFEFLLEPNPTGWEIVVRELGMQENIARLTPPLHLVPNPREIEGWHFLERPEDCTDRPYKAEAGPENPRKFIFSPEVGKRIDGPKSPKPLNASQISEIERFARGVLTIESHTLGKGKNACPKIERIRFSVQIEGGY